MRRRTTFFMMLLLLISCQFDRRLVTLKSDFNFARTVDRIDSLIAGQPSLQLITKIDFVKNAGREDLMLRPTTLFIFGNPDLYSLMITCKQTTAIDFPQRLLVWRDEMERVWIGYDTPPKSSDRWGVNCRKVRRRMLETVRELAGKAAGRYRDYFTE